MSLVFFRVAWVRRWLLFQVAHIADFSQVAPVADFSPGYARRWFLFPSRTPPSLTSISGCAHRWIFLRSRPLLIFPQVTHVAGFFPGRMSTSMTSFSGCAHRWLFSQVAPVADFSPGYARRWFLFPSRTTPSLTSISGCAHRWIFLRSRPSLILPQVTHVAGFFPGHMSTSMTSFSVRTSLTFPRSRPLLIFPQVTHVADFFFLVARLRRWLLFQVAHIAEFF